MRNRECRDPSQKNALGPRGREPPEHVPVSVQQECMQQDRRHDIRGKESKGVLSTGVYIDVYL